MNRPYYIPYSTHLNLLLPRRQTLTVFSNALRAFCTYIIIYDHPILMRTEPPRYEQSTLIPQYPSDIRERHKQSIQASWRRHLTSMICTQASRASHARIDNVNDFFPTDAPLPRYDIASGVLRLASDCVGSICNESTIINNDTRHLRRGWSSLYCNYRFLRLHPQSDRGIPTLPYSECSDIKQFT